MVRSWSCNDFSTPRLNMAETSSKFSRLLRTILSHKYFIYLTIIRWGWVYVWCEELCRSRKSMPSIEYCLYLPNLVTVCRLWGFSRGTADNKKQWSVLNEKKIWEDARFHFVATTRWFLRVKPFKYVVTQYYLSCATDLQRTIFILISYIKAFLYLVKNGRRTVWWCSWSINWPLIWVHPISLWQL